MRTWLITGCSSGIGRGTAEAVLRRGDSAAITARNTADISSLTEKYPDTALALTLDVTDNDSIDRAVKIALERFGKIDVLMNNAGFGYRSTVEESDMKIIVSLFQTHLFGPFELIKKILPGMKSRGHGVIINVSSIGGIRSAPNNGWYSASKGALELMSDALRKELQNSGVKVLTVEPGAFRTKFYVSIAGKSAANETGQPGDPYRAGEIIAGIIEQQDCPGRLLLGSDAVRSITGEFESRLDEIRTWESLSIMSDYKTGENLQ